MFIKTKVYCTQDTEVSLGDAVMCGGIPYDMGIGSGEKLEINICCDCGQVQGKYPLPQTQTEVGQVLKPKAELKSN